MRIEVKVPVLPESVVDATVATWHKSPGDTVTRDENLVDIETDKVMLEVPAPENGVLKEIVKKNGSNVSAEEIIAIIETSENIQNESSSGKTNPAKEDSNYAKQEATFEKENKNLTPAVRRLLTEHNLQPDEIKGSGKDGKIVKTDVEAFIANNKSSANNNKEEAKQIQFTNELSGDRLEKRVPMTRLRKRIAERLVESQQTAAILTTFNEVDLHAISEIRKKYQESFQKKHGIKLGFMSFFIKASVEALKNFPLVNASIDGDDIVYHGYFDIGVAVSTDRGLVVPIIRNADKLSLADIEKQIIDYGQKAKEGRLAIEDMQGGTFTVSNGGVFGSLLSTPIINPPQSGILGMHSIQKRPVVINDEIAIRPMMYLAMSYDHRIIDGKESVTFLRTIKETLEDPTRIILDL